MSYCRFLFSNILSVTRGEDRSSHGLFLGRRRRARKGTVSLFLKFPLSVRLEVVARLPDTHVLAVLGLAAIIEGIPNLQFTVLSPTRSLHSKPCRSLNLVVAPDWAAKCQWRFVFLHTLTAC